MIKSFQPSRDVPVVEENPATGQLEANARWWSFWNRLNSNSNNAGDNTDEIYRGFYQWIGPALSRLNARVHALEDHNVDVDASMSPYSARPNQNLTVDTSASNIEIILPNRGKLKISKEVDDNDINITGTINGESDWQICFGGSTADLFHNGKEWRFS